MYYMILTIVLKYTSLQNYHIHIPVYVSLQ